MKKPPALLELLDELKDEIPTSSVQTVSGSKAYIYLDENAVAAEDSIILHPEYCKLLFDSTETWAYGGYLNWQQLFSEPLRIRLFGPDADELAIRFDKAGRVTRVILPK